MNLPIPVQQYKVGDMFQVTDEYYPMFPYEAGDVGIIIKAWCDEVCIKSGTTGYAPEDGGPEFAMEWGYLGLFQDKTRLLDHMHPIKVVN
mgnify:CR=1 FL=1